MLSGFKLARLFSVLLTCVLAYTVPASQAAEPSLSIARMGTSSVGSTYYVIANGLGELLHKNANINMSVEPIGGSYANIFTMVAGKIDYAIILR